MTPSQPISQAGHTDDINFNIYGTFQHILKDDQACIYYGDTYSCF